MNVIFSIDFLLSSALATLLSDDNIVLIKETEKESVFIDNNKAEVIVKNKKKLKKICTCHDTVTASLRHALETVKSVINIRAMNLLTKVTEYHINKQFLCFQHLKNLASKLKMMTQDLNQVNLIKQLQQINKQHFNLEALKTDLQIYIWFRQTHCLSQSSDILGVYHFLEKPMSFYKSNLRKILINLRYDSDMLEQFDKTESVNIDSVFTWWWTQKHMHEKLEQFITNVTTAEFNMYLHHQWQITNKFNYEWLCTMFHSLIQQIMWQNSAY